MAPTFTKRGRSAKQETGSNRNSWGTELNIGALDRSDEMWGTFEVVVNGDVTLTPAEGLADEARQFVVRTTGAGGFAVNTPSAIDKPYLVDNQCAAAITFGPNGGTKATIRAGVATLVFTNAAGTVAYALDLPLDKIKPPTASVDMNGQKIINAAPGVADTDVPTLAQLQPFAEAAEEAAVIAIDTLEDLMAVSLGGKASDPTTDNLGNPLVTGTNYFNTTIGELRVWNGTSWQGGITSAGTLVSKWAYSTITGNTTAVNGTAYNCDTSGGPFTLTLPAAAADGVRIGVICGDSVEINALTINPNSQTWYGATTNFTWGVPGSGVIAKIDGQWRFEP